MLAPGTRLGSYEIQASLGAGGMGEVYRARDLKLDRDVAVKVLPERLADDPAALARFEREAKAVAALSHPNILGIYDFGTDHGVSFAAMELLEGDTLRQRMGGALLPLRKALDYAQQIAHGLAAAHDRGIVHRDLKPENLFILKDGRLKILDFGLAKLEPIEMGVTGQMTVAAAAGTQPGTVLGTVGYMSPEQVRGQATDQRTDIFAFGAILYEMLSGRRAFKGDSGVETMNAILKEDPLDLSEINQSLPPALDRIVRRCLEKSSDERFHSAHDVGFALEAMSGSSTPSVVMAGVAPAKSKRKFIPLVLVAAALALAGAAFFAGTKMGTKELAPPIYQRLTFRRGPILSAQFAPDGHTIVYSAAWDDHRTYQLYSTRPESPESTKLPLPNGDILSISRSGEMAILLNIRGSEFVRAGTLARVPLSGGAPREVLNDVQDADWMPDGTTLAVARQVAGRYRLEFPIGKVVYETAGWISYPRVSPSGDAVAFLDHPIWGDDRGSVAVIDRSGKKVTVSDGWSTEWGLAWSPSGDEIWFAAAEKGFLRALYAVTRAGRLRTVTRVPASFTLQDISSDGHVLLDARNHRRGLIGLARGETTPRDLSWLDWSTPIDLSPDGRLLLISENGDGGGAGYSVYLRKTDGSLAVRLGEGAASALSRDGKWVLALDLVSSPAQLKLLPTGAGEARGVTHDQIHHQFGNFFPDGRRIVFVGNEPGRKTRVFVQDLAGGAPRPITPEGVASFPVISPDGRFVVCTLPDGVPEIYPVDGGDPRTIPGLDAVADVLQWSADGRALYVRRTAEERGVAKVYRVDLVHGTRTTMLEIEPSLGVSAVEYLLLTPDGKSYVYGSNLTQSDLYMVEGLK